MKKISRRKFIHGSSFLGASLILFNDSNAGRIFLRSRGFDIIIKGGHVIDGLGTKEFIADVGIKDGKIIEIGNLNSVNAVTLIDAKGLKVVPGFIDIHSHTDSDLILNPKAENKIRQGVTTEITGQDGFSWGPLGGPEIERTMKNFKEEYGEELTWRTLGEFLDNFSSRKFSVNLASMVGLGTIREFVVGFDDRPSNSDEMDLMKNEVIKAINESAI